MKKRFYDIGIRDGVFGLVHRMGLRPMTHSQAFTFKSKMTPRAKRTISLVEIYFFEEVRPLYPV